MANRTDAPSLTLTDVLTRVRKAAAADVADGVYAPNLDIPRLHRSAGTVLTELAHAAAEDNTPRLFNIPNAPGVTFASLIETLRVASVAASTKPGSRELPPAVDADHTVPKAIAAAEDVHARLVLAINGNKPKSKAAAALRLALFADRQVAQSKGGWETEITTLITAISNPANNATPAVSAMVPVLEEVLAVLKAAVAQPGGRPAGATWTVVALEAAAALDVALGELLSWAAVFATKARRIKIQRALGPRRRSDDSDDKKQEEEPEKPEKPAEPTPG